MYYKYVGHDNEFFKTNETYHIDHVSKYDVYVCSENMKILSPNDIYQDFRKVYLDDNRFLLVVETDDHGYKRYDLKKLVSRA